MKILLVGTGYMASEYAKVLRDHLRSEFWVLGRNPEKTEAFAKQFSAAKFFTYENLKNADLTQTSFSILANSIDSLIPVGLRLIQMGARQMLIEKPVALSSTQSSEFLQEVRKQSVIAKVAYNRRYYQSILSLKEILDRSPPLAAHFDFTEWAWQIGENQTYSSYVKSRWALANSVHVFDTVQYLLGQLKMVQNSKSDLGSIDWHPTPATFAGLLMAETTPITYSTSWIGPGRWDIQVITKEGRYRLCPMEKLQVLPPKTIHWAEVPLNYELDTNFKPGLAKMVEAFIHDPQKNALPSLEENHHLVGLIESVVGYSP